jgi:hypothetical protein
MAIFREGDTDRACGRRGVGRSTVRPVVLAARAVIER